MQASAQEAAITKNPHNSSAGQVRSGPVSVNETDVSLMVAGGKGPDERGKPTPGSGSRVGGLSGLIVIGNVGVKARTRTNTIPYGTEASAAG